MDGADPDNILIKQRRDFEAVCVALKTQGIAEPKNLTIFEFFSTVDYFESRKKKGTPNTPRS